MTNEKIIQINKLSFVYEREEEDNQIIRTEALKDISMEIERGSFVAVIGQNGSGKSTLAKQLNALFLPTGGAVVIEGRNTSDSDPIEIRSMVGMVFQNPDNQLVSSVVEDDVAFGPENLGVAPDEIRKRVDEALKKVSMYEHRKKAPHHLSGGQKQRIAIAGVLAMQPDVIVFDEPTAMLDPLGRAEIMNIIEELHNDGKTVVLITHFMEEAARADRIAVINKGELIFDGAPKELFVDENAAMLNNISLEFPFAAKLANKLRENGLEIPKSIITQEALADYLCKLK